MAQVDLSKNEEVNNTPKVKGRSNSSNFIKPSPINLLPHELKPKKYVVKISKTLKRISMIGLLLFVVATAVIIGAFFVVSRQLNSSLDNQKKLQQQIKAQEQTEQKIALIADRLDKINEIFNSPNASDELNILSQTLKRLPEGVVFQQAKLSAEEAAITINAASSSDLARFLAVIVGSGSYRRVELLSFNFSPEKGYEVEFGVSN